MANDVTVVVSVDNKNAVSGLKQVSSEADSLGRSAQESEGHLGRLGGTLGTVGKIAGGFVLAQGLLQLPGLVSGFIGGASDLNESLSKVQTVFGSSSKEIETWAGTAAKSIGMPKQAALEAAGTFGNFLQAMGATNPEATKMSKGMVQLAADLGSFNNANPEEVLLALRSGLSGEAEPLRKFGVALSVAAVEAKGAQLGLGKLGKEMSEQEKIQARYAIIMEQTTTAQGDFERTSGGLANQSKILKAELKDLSDNMGTALLPAVVGVTAALVAFLPTLVDIGSAVGSGIGAGFGVLATVFQTLQPFFAPMIVGIAGVAAVILGSMIPAGLAWIAVEYAKVTAFLASAAAFVVANAPLIAIGLAVGVLVAGIVLLVQHWDEITQKVPALGVATDAVKVALKAISAFITGTLVPAISTLAGWFSDHIVPVLGTLINSYLAPLKLAFEAVSTAVTGVVVPAFQTLWGVFNDDILPILQKVSDVIREWAPKIAGWLNDVVDKFMGWIDTIKGIFGPLLSFLVTVGEDIVKGLWNGVLSMKDWFMDKFTGFIGSIKDKAMDLLKINSPSKVFHEIGESIGEGLGDGIDASVGPILTYWDGAINKWVSEQFAKVASVTGGGGAGSGAGGFMTAAGGAMATYIGGGQYGTMPSSTSDTSSSAAVGYYNPSTDLTWTGDGWTQGNWWKPGDPTTKTDMAGLAAMGMAKTTTINLVVDGAVLATAVTDQLAKAM